MKLTTKEGKKTAKNICDTIRQVIEEDAPVGVDDYLADMAMVITALESLIGDDDDGEVQG